MEGNQRKQPWGFNSHHLRLHPGNWIGEKQGEMEEETYLRGCDLP